MRSFPIATPLWRAGLIVGLAAFAAPAAGESREHALESPDGRLQVRVRTDDRIRYDVLLKGDALLRDSSLSMTVDGTVLGQDPEVRSAKPRTVDRIVEPPIHQKAAELREHFNELRLEMEGGYAVVFRAFDEGVAYRFETRLGDGEVQVDSEEVALNFGGNWPLHLAQEESFFSHNERHFVPRTLGDLSPETLASTPAVVDAGVARIAIADSDVEGYPGLWLRGTGGSALAGTFPPLPLKEKLTRDRDFRVVEAADHIAVTSGTRAYPWRVIGVAEKDTDLITSSLVYLLASPSRIEDTSWIRPGKVAWDWYNATNLFGVDFVAGVNTETYKYYIDFASEYGLEYVILDEGWYPLGDLLTVVPEIDMEELLAYAKAKGVGIVPWVVWKTLDDQFDAAMDQFERWGVKGLKIDFMQRDDQKMIDYYHRVCREAARRKLFVDLHGAIRPAEMTRTWPNLLSTEGVLGLEQFKWSDNSNPEHNVTLPFTRMYVGPLDYTPGAMRNASRQSFAPIFEQPMSLGTRCQQLAMYVVYESPLQMLADTPSSYLREPEIMEFLGPVPTVWDETRALAGRIGDFVVVARRHGSDWWVGAMTDESPRDLEIALDFLPAGAFEIDAYQDGVNAARWASDYTRVRQEATRATRLAVHLAPGGGWAARVSPRR